MYRRPASVLVIVATRDGHVLLLRRRRPAGYWQSVTGSLGWDETPPEAARRELREETGLVDALPCDCRRTFRFRIDPRFGHRYAPGVEFNTEHVFQLVLERPRPIELQPDEHSEYRWLALTEALTAASSQTNREALRELAAVPGRDVNPVA